MFDYASLKSLARDRHQAVDDLLALSPKNDPFYTGSAGQVEGAQWFAGLYHRFYGSGEQVHLRRIHYRIVSQDPPVAMPSGEPYQNTDGCWNYLTSVSKWARYLGLVSVDAFVDKRNQDPICHAYFYSWASEAPAQYVESNWRDGVDDLALPDLPSLPDLPDLPALPKLLAGGYDVQQPYLIEIWVEKTTMNDVLEPLCQRYSCNLITGAGELSITAVRAFLKRAEDAGRPARILYISDFDPAGLGMPISIARKIEFYQRSEDRFSDLDIALEPLVLTEDQVARFSLPRVPVKDSDLRKGRFEAGHGEGQVELDALEALYPGTLRRIVRDAILRYFDPALSETAAKAKARLQERLDGLGAEAEEEFSSELDALRTDFGALVEEYQATQAAFAALIAPFQAQLEVYRERLEEIQGQAREVFDGFEGRLEEAGGELDLEPYRADDPDVEGDSGSLLYESTRSYFDQLEAYAAQRDGVNSSDGVGGA